MSFSSKREKAHFQSASQMTAHIESKPLRTFELFIPEKWIWTQDDFSRLVWADVFIHSIGMIKSWGKRISELLFDIDYIWTRQLPSKTEAKLHEFWISPATLVFQHVYELKMDFGSTEPGIVMQGLTMREEILRSGVRSYQWEITLGDIAGDTGKIRFLATGFHMFIRKKPIGRGYNPYLESDQRRGISFERETPSD